MDKEKSKNFAEVMKTIIEVKTMVVETQVLVRKATGYLKSYQKLAGDGLGGRMLSDEYKEFQITKLEHENIMDWCVRKALELLQGKKEVTENEEQGTENEKS